MTLTKETLMSRISQYTDILDVELVKVSEYTNITYKCGHISKGILSNLLYNGNNSTCTICNPKSNSRKTHQQFLKEIGTLALDIEFIEEYKDAKSLILFKYKSCGHIHKARSDAFRKGSIDICRICNPINKKSKQEFLERINPNIEILNEYINNKTYITFKYKSCGHIHKARPDNMLNGSNIICRICNPIKKSNEVFLQQAALRGLDIKFLEEYIDSTTPILFTYISCGHISKVSPNTFLNNTTICKICRICNPIKKTHQQFLKEVSILSSDILLLEEYTGDKNLIRFKYKSCNHEHKVTPSNLLSKGTGLICRTCNPLLTSKGEKDIAELLSKYTIVETSNRSILEGLEIDIYLPEFKIGIEYNGEYWHSDKYKDKNYHLAKTDTAKQQGIKLIHIFEHEWLQKQDIVKSRLLGMLQQNYKLGARKCIVKELAFNEVKDFLNENHLQGSGSPSKYNLGLLYNDLLVAVMTFSKPRFNSNYDYELIRYCSLIDINIQGGASKLLKYFTSKYQGSIISYSDKRWSDGNLYKTLGFEYSHSSEPSYFYAKNSTILSRYLCQKHKLKDLVPDFYEDKLSESDIMANAGFNKVYDCGTDVWLL